MPRQLHLEGPVLQPLLERARAEHGGRLRVVDAHRVRRGGVAGFFTREHYEVTIEVADPAGPAPDDLDVAGPGPATIEQLLAAADRADGAGAAAGATARATARATDGAGASARAGDAGGAAPAAVRLPGRCLSTESRGFDEVLAALRADLLGPGSDVDDARTVPSLPSRVALPAASPATPWQPVTVLDAPDPAPATPAPEPPAPATPAPETPAPEPPAPATPAPETPADAVTLDGLLGLALTVGADPALAAAAAHDVAGSGAVGRRHALPLLAASLATAMVPEVDPHGRSADLLGARAGEVVVVLGAPDRVGTTAARVAEQLGTPWSVRWSDEPGGRRPGGADPVLHDVRALPALAGKARSAGLPLVVALPDPTLADGVAPSLAGTARAALLRGLDPDLVVLVVAADVSRRSRHAVVDRVGDACAHRSLMLALVGCGEAAAPLAHADRPVALLDGRPATVGAWTGVLLDALLAAAAR